MDRRFSGNRSRGKWWESVAKDDPTGRIEVFPGVGETSLVSKGLGGCKGGSTGERVPDTRSQFPFPQGELL